MGNCPVAVDAGLIERRCVLANCEAGDDLHIVNYRHKATAIQCTCYKTNRARILLIKRAHAL